MKYFIILIILISQTIPSFGQMPTNPNGEVPELKLGLTSGVADGKSIICKCIDCDLPYSRKIGWKFVKYSQVIMVWTETYQDKVHRKEESWGTYWSNETTIGWNREGMNRELNRETLIMTDLYWNNQKSKCTVYDNNKDFDEVFKKIIDREQKKYDESTNKNKI